MAQLNSASDYGSEGCRFESCRGHLRIKRKLASLGCQFFYACFRRKLACARIKGIKKGAAQQRLFFLDLDYGAQRKTRDPIEGNPHLLINNPQQGQLQVSSAAGQSQIHSLSGYFSHEANIIIMPKININLMKTSPLTEYRLAV